MQNDDVSLAALIISIISLTVIAWLTGRQIRISEKTMNIPIVIDMFREFRKPEFKQHVAYIHNKLEKDNPDPKIGIYDIALPGKNSIIAVSHFFDNLGFLIIQKIVDEKTVISFMGESIQKVWDRLEPYIRAQRKKDFPEYQAYFEHLVSRVKKNHPSKIREKLELEKIESSK